MFEGKENLTQNRDKWGRLPKPHESFAIFFSFISFNLPFDMLQQQLFIE